MQLPQFTNDQIIAIASAFAAVVSAIYAGLSARTARRALELSLADHQERHTELKTYLIDGVTWEVEKGDCLVVFACSVSNTANAPISIVRGDLHVHAFDRDGEVAEIVLLPVSAVEPPDWNLKPLSLPLNLSARTTESGWIGYRIPARVVTSMSIDRYQLIFVSSSGGSASVEQYLIRRISNADSED